MPTLAQLLADPIDAANPDTRDFLEDLQANILKGHGRDFAAHIAVSFAGMAPDAVAALLRKLAPLCKSAGDQLRNNRRPPLNLDGGPVRCLFLSANGYRALGPLAVLPAGVPFSDGMRASALGDPPPGQWDPGWNDAEPPVDAMILIADAQQAVVTQEVADVTKVLLDARARILVVEHGCRQYRTFSATGVRRVVEHFGYADGLSQPLILQEAIANEPVAAGGPFWRPDFPAKRFIVADPNGRSAHAAGSFVVFRKLEQNVRGFRTAVEDLARTLGTHGTGAVGRAGAMVVGRYQDGTPLTKGIAPAGAEPPLNDFDYAHDPAGALCPFHAHIRKTNPRNATNPFERTERDPIMARRGITYGPRARLANDSDFDPTVPEPTEGVGLLFIAYMSDIAQHFEVVQKNMANNPDFPRAGTGIDPLIGQGAAPGYTANTFFDGRITGATAKSLSFGNFVTMKGGEYFFAPSLSFLRGVGL